MSVCLLATGCGKSKSESSNKTGGGKSGTSKKNRNWPLDEFKGKNPVVVIVTGSHSNPRYQKFVQQWQSVDAEAHKLQLVVMEVFFNSDNQSGGIRNGRSFSLQEARNMYDNFQLGPNALAVTLIGKDGKQIEKIRSPKTPREVLDLLKK